MPKKKKPKKTRKELYCGPSLGPPPERSRWTSPFTIEESEALMEGLSRHAKKANRYAAIMQDPDLKEKLRGRTSVALKDKVRNWRKNGSQETKAKLNQYFHGHTVVL